MKSIFRRRKGLSCDQVMEALQSYLDGETDADTAKEVAAHLPDCEDCNLESSVYQRIKMSLIDRPETIDPEIITKLRDFADRVARDEIDQ
ncbi:MAG: anti-sigma factor RsiW [Acidimicrobiales bacterium]|jgi:anti-sigma factor RsiW